MKNNKQNAPRMALSQRHTSRNAGIFTLLSLMLLLSASKPTFAQCDVLAMPHLISACPGDIIPMPASLSGGSTVLGYTWTPPAGLSSSTVLNPTLVAPSTSGWYHLTVQSTLPTNLVVNGDFSAGNSGFGSAYAFVPNSSMALYPAGKYAIVTNPSLDHPTAASFGDHTTGSGNMMAINGASTPVNVWTETISVTPFTNYAFSAWFTNWSANLSTNLPILQFRVNGVPLGAGSFSIPATPGLWSQYYATWNSGALSSVVITIYDSQTASDGNDFAIDDIAFRQLCTASDSVYVDVTCPPTCNTLDMPDSLHLCIGDSVIIPATASGPDSILSVTWTPPTGLSSTTILNPMLTSIASGWYYVTMQSLIPGNLITNGDFTAGNTGFTSSYTFVPNSSMALWPAGVYAIVIDPILDHPTAASFGDHTTGTGNMMAINGASTPIDVWCSTVTVTPNTDYAFSAWFANWSANTTTNLPQIIFKINGVLMSSTPFTFPPTYGVWSQFYSTWNSGTLSGPISICIYDQQTAANGNDFAIDDISFQKICTTKDSVYLDALNCKHQCADSSNITYTSTTDKNGNCIITATATVSSVYSILGYRWSGAGTPITHINHTGSDSYTFILPAGATVNLSCVVYIVDTTLSDSTGPCCQVQLSEKITCNPQQPCVDMQKSTLTYYGTSMADGSCTFTCTATAYALPPWTITGYMWSVNGGAAMPGGPTFTTMPIPPGTSATVTVTILTVNKNGEKCSYDMTIEVFCDGKGNPNPVENPSGKPANTAQIADANNIVIYPNPTDNNVTVTASKGISSIQVIDVNGKKVKEAVYNSTGSETIPLNNLAPGTYLFKINNTFSKVVIKIK